MKVSRCLELVGSIITYLSLLQSAPAHRSNIGVQPWTYSVNRKVGDVTFEYKGLLSNDILLNEVSEHQDTHINLPQHQRGQQTGRHEFEGEYIIQVDYLQPQYTFHCQDLLNTWMLRNWLVSWISNWHSINWLTFMHKTSSYSLSHRLYVALGTACRQREARCSVT